jgi:hypothetical protein
MGDFTIDFEWPIAKYELRPPDEDENWRVSDSDLRDIPKDQWPLYRSRIVPISKGTEHRPKAQAMELAVKALVECKQTPFQTVVLKVARTVGNLFPDEHGCDLARWYRLAKELRWMFEGRDRVWQKYKWPEPETWYKGQIDILLIPDANNKPMLSLQPRRLHQALTLYAARMIATGTTFNICENCKTPFLSGGSGRNKKRGDARFCSDTCRWKYHNESRRKAR